MANSTTIRISAIDQTREAFQSVQRNLGGLQNNLKGIAGSIAAAFSVAAIGAFSKNVIDSANAILDLSDKTGIAATELSRLQNAATLNASSAEEFNAAIIRLQKSIAEAGAGAKVQTDAFEALGITVTDTNGNLRPTLEIFDQIADKFARSEDGANKLKVAQDLLGKSGADLIPLLNQGSEALSKYQSSFSNEFIEQSAKFNENIDKLVLRLKSLASTLLGPVLTAVNKFFDLFEENRNTLPEVVVEAQALTKEIITLKKEVGDFVTFTEAAQQKIFDFDYANLRKEWEQVTEGVKLAGFAMDDVGRNAIMNLEDSILGLMNGTKTLKEAFSEMAVSIINDLLRMYIRYQITKPLFDAFFGATGGPAAPIVMSSPGVPTGRAIGGPVSAGTSYMVGERGPEMFIPNASGAIVPTDKIGGGQTIVNQTINLSAGVSQTVRTEVMSMMPRILEATKSAVIDAKRRGGSFSKAFA